MNCVIRVRTDRRSLIVKQSRPWVEKYPQFAAPWDRACREAEFYQITAGIPGVAEAMPRLLFSDPEARVLILEDLGDSGDYSDLYRGGLLTGTDVDQFVAYLTALHNAHSGAGTAYPSMANREMRELNHAHIFRIPLANDNGLDLDSVEPGLQAAAAALKRDAAFVAAVERLGREVYLADGPCLLHGDFFPGSIVRTPAGPRVIDPEFCHFGRPEYDVAILLAHLILAGQPGDLIARLGSQYRAPGPFDEVLVVRLAGTEIMRRLIGYAQLRATWPADMRIHLLALARRMVLDGRAL